MRPLDEIRRLIEIYPPEFRRWCDAPENGGCACMGCVRWPAPSTVYGDPEGKPFPNPADRLTREETLLYTGQAAERSATGADTEIGELVKDIGERIAAAFKAAAIADPPQLGFCLWVFEFTLDPFVACVSNEFSNARRPELIRLMREHLARLEAEERAETLEPEQIS